MPPPTSPETARDAGAPRVRRLGADDRRDELLAAAHALALADGLDAVTAPGVAAAAHASKALVFHYFGSTVELRRAVASVAVDALDAALATTETTTGTTTGARTRTSATRTGAARTTAEATVPPDDETRRRVVRTLVDAVVAHRRVWVDIWDGALRDDPPTVERLDALRGHLFARVAQLTDPSDARLDLVATGWVAFVEAVIARWLAADQHGRQGVAGAAGGTRVGRSALEDLVVRSMTALLGPAGPTGT